ncbi:hypothetical protein JHK85_011539 [Glycine max]|uniref:Uncharacterized protein n=1 Tax=Glycine soja TaxID=3848 RepID=A0A0B2SHH2_GLYSO|nr:hypothetical protein JHK87_011103 [Glycine soja]KAG5050436.1 hypothetical protein JHK85_011539 [Glycine max]KAG5067490.1 hypothetical protein JHK86_011221 [Glycine max]KAH1113019.1 hypothetical protein GYH30_010967 [Glycine max]KHN44283.1 hypothetical protein glysoja_024503 [Glycine soja]
MEKKVHVGMGSVHRTRPASSYNSNRKDSFPPSRGSIKRKIFIFICGKIRQRILAYMVSST